MMEPGAGLVQRITLQDICNRFEISPRGKDDLGQLINKKIALVLDDSGSMNEPSDSVGHATRFDELCAFVDIVIALISVLKETCVDCYFLNRGTVKNVTSSTQIKHLFGEKPDGYTPLLTRVRDVINDHTEPEELLLIIATDGVPSDGKPEQLRQLLLSVSDRVYTSIVACTNDENVMDMLNDMDNSVPRLDVTDDYQTERTQIRAVQGTKFPFSRGDWVVKTLLGPMNTYYDQLDEPVFKPRKICNGYCSIQ